MGQAPVRDNPAQRQAEQRAIVQRMIDAGETEENIATVIKHFEKTPPPPVDPTGGRSVASRAVGGFLTGTGIAGIPGFVGEALTQNPLTTAYNLGKGFVEPLGRLGNVPEAYRQGGLTGALNETAASIPIIGPAAESASQRMKSGDVAGGAGEVVGMIASPFFEPFKALKSGFTNTARLTGAGERMAPTLNRMAESRIVETIAPKVGKNKVRFGNQAADVAPRLAREEGMGAATRAQLADKVGVKLEEATTALDTAHDARNAGRAYPTAPLIKALEAERLKLTAEAVEGSKRVPGEGLSPSGLVKVPEAIPIGKDVVPSPNATRVAVIDKAISELKQLGSLARYDAIRQIRGAYDQVAKVKYAPSMTQDFLTKAGEASGAADVTRVLREHLGTFDKGTAAANTQYAFWRKVDDVFQAAEETERVRPHAGRTMITRVGGAMTGAATGGDLTHVLGGLLIGEGLDRVVNSGVTTKVMMARELAKMADALRGNKPQLAKGALARFARYAGLSSRLTGLLNEQQERESKEPQ